jgi:hypothetical protein
VLPAARRHPGWRGTNQDRRSQPGLEWYVRHRNGVEWGWQAKYSFKVDDVLKLIEKSLRTVVDKRPKCRRLTFCIPFDLPDARGPKERKSARQKFEDRKKSWRARISGADRVTIGLISASELLDRLSSHPAEGGPGGRRTVAAFRTERPSGAPACTFCYHRCYHATNSAARRRRSQTRKTPHCGASPVRPGRLELPRAIRPTRPSTLRVYQFRHRRVTAADYRSRPRLRPGA